MLGGRLQPGFLRKLLRITAAGKPNRGPWRRQSRRPCRLPRASKPKSRRPPRAAGPLDRRRSTLRCQSSVNSDPTTRDRLRGSRLLQVPSSRAAEGERLQRIPLSVRLAQGLVGALAVSLLLHTTVSDPDLWRFQTLNQVVCGTLLLGAAIAGLFGLYRSPLICKACAVIGWWVGLWSLLLNRALNPVPIMGMAIFFIAGLAADALDDSQHSPAGENDDIPGEKAVRELVFRRWGPGI